MATRIQKTRECDRAKCRNRKGVRRISLSLDVHDGDEDWPGTVTGGELCPDHIRMAERFIENIFKNTKEYDDELTIDCP